MNKKCNFYREERYADTHTYTTHEMPYDIFFLIPTRAPIPDVTLLPKKNQRHKEELLF